jgi:hypothetical protein
MRIKFTQHGHQYHAAWASISRSMGINTMQHVRQLYAACASIPPSMRINTT